MTKSMHRIDVVDGKPVLVEMPVEQWPVVNDNRIGIFGVPEIFVCTNGLTDQDTCMVPHQDDVPRDANGRLAFVAKGKDEEESIAIWRREQELKAEEEEEEVDYLPAKGIYLWEKLFGRMYTRVFLSDDVAKMFLDRLGKEKTTNKSFYLIEKDSEGNRVYLNNDDRYSLVTVAKADEKQEWFEYPITIKGMGHANSPFEEDQLLGKAESYEQLEDLECMLMSKYPDVHGVKVFGGKRDHVEAYGGITDLGEIVKNVRRVIGRGTR